MRSLIEPSASFGGGFDMIVTARNGRLTLSGEVYWDSDREAAECTVRKLSGVTGVTNLITTKDIRR